MRLTELEPKFLKIDGINFGSFRRIDSIDEADGIIFICPVCFTANRGNVGSHSIICWRPKAPQAVNLTGPGRWEFTGTGYEDLTLVAESSSVLLRGGCNAHFFVRDGNIDLC